MKNIKIFILLGLVGLCFQNMYSRPRKENAVKVSAKSTVAQNKAEAVSSVDPGKTVIVIASGDGKTKDEAIKFALRSAIEQTFGTFVSAKTEVLNDELVTDEVVSISTGTVHRYTEMQTMQMSNGNTSVMLEAVISISNLVKYAQNKGMETELSGATLLENRKIAELNLKSKGDALCHLFHRVFSDLPNLADYEISTEEPRMEGGVYIVPTKIYAKTNSNLENFQNLINDGILEILFADSKSKYLLNQLDWNSKQRLLNSIRKNYVYDNDHYPNLDYSDRLEPYIKLRDLRRPKDYDVVLQMDQKKYQEKYKNANVLLSDYRDNRNRLKQYGLTDLVPLAYIECIKAAELMYYTTICTKFEVKDNLGGVCYLSRYPKARHTNYTNFRIEMKTVRDDSDLGVKGVSGLDFSFHFLIEGMAELKRERNSFVRNDNHNNLLFGYLEANTKYTVCCFNMKYNEAQMSRLKSINVIPSAEHGIPFSKKYFTDTKTYQFRMKDFYGENYVEYVREDLRRRGNREITDAMVVYDILYNYYDFFSHIFSYSDLNGEFLDRHKNDENIVDKNIKVSIFNNGRRVRIKE